MNQIVFIFNIISRFFFNNFYFYYDVFNQLVVCNALGLENFENKLICIFRFFNIKFEKLTNDFIKISFFNNECFLIPISTNGFFLSKVVGSLYNLQYFPINIYNSCSGNLEPLFLILKISNLTKKFPTTFEEIQFFFYNLKFITDFNYIGNINLDDIFYDDINNIYLILNVKCLEPKSPYIDTKLENLLNDKKNIYYFNNQPLDSEEYYFFKSMGVI